MCLSFPQNLSVVLARFIKTGVKRHLLRVSLRSLRILSRDKKILGHLVTDSTLLTLAKLAGLTTGDASSEANDSDSDFYDDIIASLAKAKVLQSHRAEDEGEANAAEQSEECPLVDEDLRSGTSDVGCGDLDSIGCLGSHRTSVHEMHRGGSHQKVLERGRKDRRESKMDGEEEEDEEGELGDEALRKEAMKVLCNVVYNSSWAQERFSSLRWVYSQKHRQFHKFPVNPFIFASVRLLSGLIHRLSSGVSCSPPSSVQFYELRLMFLITALRPELSAQLRQVA